MPAHRAATPGPPAATLRGLCVVASMHTQTHLAGEAPYFSRDALLPLVVPHRVLNRDVTAYIAAQRWLPGPSAEHAATVAAAVALADEDLGTKVESSTTKETPTKGTEPDRRQVHGTEAATAALHAKLSSVRAAHPCGGWIDCLPWAIAGDPRCVTMHTRYSVEDPAVIDALCAAPDVSSVAALYFRRTCAVTEELEGQLERLARHLTHSARLAGAVSDGDSCSDASSDSDLDDEPDRGGVAAITPAFAGGGLRDLNVAFSCPSEMLQPLLRVPSLTSLRCCRWLPYPLEPMPSLRRIHAPLCSDIDEGWFGKERWASPDGALLFPELTDLDIAVPSKLLLSTIVSSCPQLQRLSFKSKASVPSSDIASLSGLPQLTKLLLMLAPGSEPLRHDAAVGLSTLVNLTHLRLRAPANTQAPGTAAPVDCTKTAEADGPFSLDFLPRLPRLRKLHFAGNVGDLAPVGECVGLSQLNLVNVRVSAASALAIGALPLVELRCGDVEIDPSDYDAMFNPALQTVLVRRPPRGLHGVCRARGLHTVILHQATTLDASSMSALGGLPLLRLVHLVMCNLSRELLCAFLFGEADFDAALAANGPVLDDPGYDSGTPRLTEPVATDVTAAVAFAASWARDHAGRLQHLKLFAMPCRHRLMIPDAFLLGLAHLPGLRTARFSNAVCSHSALLAFAETVDPRHPPSISISVEKLVLDRARDVMASRRADAARGALVAPPDNSCSSHSCSAEHTAAVP